MAEAENLHDVGKGSAKKMGDKFVTPGIPGGALVSMSDRNTGKISDAANAAIKSNLENNTRNA